MNSRNNSRRNEFDSNVIDLAARRRCQLERRGFDPIAKAVHLLAETGQALGVEDGYDDDGDWAA
ncbi:hypothetical protein ACWDYH_29700 [Nocardia goodfellowii]